MTHHAPVAQGKSQVHPIPSPGGFLPNKKSAQGDKLCWVPDPSENTKKSSDHPLQENACTQRSACYLRGSWFPSMSVQWSSRALPSL